MQYSVFPYPLRLDVEDGEPVFTLTSRASLTDESSTAGIFDDFNDFLFRAFGFVPFGGGEEKIVLTLDEKIENAEGYVLSCGENLVRISAGAPAGLFYGLQTLKQLLLQGGGKLCRLYIEDKPEFPQRGFMLDVSRYFFTVESVKLFIDAMALHKLNRLHLHLTDDQGWRIEIEKYPLLTVIGSHRACTNFNTVGHRGFYTKDDIRDIVSYAHSKYIRVVPEIDMPGHSVSAIASYPFLSCFDRELDVATHFGIKHDILCAGKESTYRFVFDVLDEVAELFPDNELHLGADEAVKMRWELCEFCQKKIKELSLGGEDELQAHFISRIREHFAGRGIRLMLWSEPGSRYERDIAFQYWNAALSPREISDEINAGRPVINSSSDAYYLDFPYGKVNLRQCYEYEPRYEHIKNADCFLGVEAALWSEYVPSMEKAGYCAFPRLGAVCETAWTAPRNKDYGRFERGIPAYFSLLELYGLPHASLKQAMPGFFRKYGYLLYWKRRPLHWEGLHNLIDDARVKKEHEPG